MGLLRCEYKRSHRQGDLKELRLKLKRNAFVLARQATGLLFRLFCLALHAELAPMTQARILPAFEL